MDPTSKSDLRALTPVELWTDYRVVPTMQARLTKSNKLVYLIESSNKKNALTSYYIKEPVLVLTETDFKFASRDAKITQRKDVIVIDPSDAKWGEHRRERQENMVQFVKEKRAEGVFPLEKGRESLKNLTTLFKHKVESVVPQLKTALHQKDDHTVNKITNQISRAYAVLSQKKEGLEKALFAADDSAIKSKHRKKIDKYTTAIFNDAISLATDALRQAKSDLAMLNREHPFIDSCIDHSRTELLEKASSLQKSNQHFKQEVNTLLSSLKSNNNPKAVKESIEHACSKLLQEKKTLIKDFANGRLLQELDLKDDKVYLRCKESIGMTNKLLHSAEKASPKVSAQPKISIQTKLSEKPEVKTSSLLNTVEAIHSYFNKNSYAEFSFDSFKAHFESEYGKNTYNNEVKKLLNQHIDHVLNKQGIVASNLSTTLGEKEKISEDMAQYLRKYVDNYHKKHPKNISQFGLKFMIEDAERKLRANNPEHQRPLLPQTWFSIAMQIHNKKIAANLKDEPTQPKNNWFLEVIKSAFKKDSLRVGSLSQKAVEKQPSFSLESSDSTEIDIQELSIADPNDF